MQVNLNSKASNKPYFGMAIHSNENVNKLIKLRIKNNVELEKLKKIIDKQSNNKLVDITLLTDGKRICANVYTLEQNEQTHRFNKQFNENFLTKIFGGTVGFIEKVANYADNAATKIQQRKAMDIDGVLNKMK